MWEWEIIIEVWPYSTGQGADTDQQACGPRTHLQIIRADDFAIASKYANVAACALKSNPRVWQAPIASVRRLSSGETAARA